MTLAEVVTIFLDLWNSSTLPEILGSFWYTDSSRAKKFSCYVHIRFVALKDTGNMYEDETALGWLHWNYMYPPILGLLSLNPVMIFEAYRFRAGTTQCIPMWTTTSVGMVIVLEILWYTPFTNSGILSIQRYHHETHKLCVDKILYSKNITPPFINFGILSINNPNCLRQKAF